MIRARSPFFYFNLFFGWLAAVCFIMHWAFNWNLYGSYGEGASIFQTIDQMSTLTLFLTGAFALCFLVTLVCEWRISRGWEPRYLETFKPGCEIIEMRASRGDHATVLVNLSDGTQETYLADRQEMKELEIDSVSHLWVIGKHISRIRKIGEGGADFEIKKFAKLRLMPGRSLADSIFMLAILLIVSVLFTGVGARIAIVKEFVLSGGRRYYSEPSYMVIDGAAAVTTGLVLLAVGLAIITTMSVLWKRGWDASEIQSGLESYDRWT